MPTYLAACVTFIGASLGCGFSPTAEILVLFRALQGAGGALRVCLACVLAAGSNVRVPGLPALSPEGAVAVVVLTCAPHVAPPPCILQSPPS
jgi:MFS family permease